MQQKDFPPYTLKCFCYIWCRLAVSFKMHDISFAHAYMTFMSASANDHQGVYPDGLTKGWGQLDVETIFHFTPRSTFLSETGLLMLHVTEVKFI